jgi:hypothetical protein
MIKLAAQAGDFKFHILAVGHRQPVADAGLMTGDPLILLNAQQHVRGLAVLGDENGTHPSRFSRSAGILVKFLTGKPGNSHRMFPLVHGESF